MPQSGTRGGLGPRATKLTRRQVLAGATAACLASVSTANARPGYPGDRTVRVIVGFPAGGSQDNVGRIIADRLSAISGTGVVVENFACASSDTASKRGAKGIARGSQTPI